MKGNLDIYAVGIGVMGAVLKGVKHKLNMKSVLLSGAVSAILAYGTIGVLDMFFSNLEPRIIILVSFAVGWISNELMDILDAVVKDSYDVFIAWGKEKVNKFLKK
jgi:hypothetical protein